MEGNLRGDVIKELFSSTKRIVIKIIPHRSTSVYKVEMSHRHAAIVAAALVVVVCAIVTFQIGAVHAAEVQVRSLQQADASQRQQLVSFSHKTADMLRRLKALQRNEREIKRLAGISDASAHQKPRAVVPKAATAQAMVRPAPALSHESPAPIWSFLTRVGSWLRGGDVNGGVTFASESSELASLDVELNESLAQSRALEARAQALATAREAAAQAHQQYLDGIPSIWPTDGYVSSGFGYRSYPDAEFHPGLDIENDYGSPIYATASGVVEEADWDSGGYGYRIVIDHGNGYVTWYAHDSRLLVSAGETVRKGEEIALVGATGFATGPHCHYELLLWGKPIDPTPFL